MSAPVVEALVTLGRRYVRGAPVPVGKALLAGRVLSPRLREHPRRRVTGTRFGVRVAVDTRDLIQRYLYLFGVWEPHMTRWLRRRLRPGDTYVDVGANIGYHTLLAAHLVGEGGHVVAIEASPALHRHLLRNVALNEFRNVRAVNRAVSDTDEILSFVLASSANTGANSIVPYVGPAEAAFDIAARPLPALLAEGEITRARVIKIDVEGAEGSVVRGMRPMLPRLRPDAEITVEVAPARMARLGDSAGELMETMRAHGFHAYRLVNAYTPESYAAALRGTARVPERLRGPVTGENDLVFSKIDADSLP
ncbi:FkbM family methyltransferase [Streptomyces sp. RS10V-4]|uniref:FkbM family methyltransferase n=1 Tax=Streptomyces rhizoryzae TaxID=2932493 RepID=UPI002004C768|nr:FkbM family methyltransferase [Streptomyces rhizoryzae]MCK7626873.1 FkbM family methyltransferase [Streptomyces rhizoryzae]